VLEPPPEDQAEVRETAALSPGLLDDGQTGEAATPEGERPAPPPDTEPLAAGEAELPAPMEASPEDQAEVRETAAWSPDLVEGEQTGEETTLPRELASPPPEALPLVPSLTAGDQTAEEATPEEEHPAPLAAGAAELPEDQSAGAVEPIIPAPAEGKYV
jgi:hypothetical protein